jgi:acyloxyacyl hydrolase
LFDLSNELDAPQASSWTGYTASNPNGPGIRRFLHGFNFVVESVYLSLRKRNQCNHRDYQNLGVNGLRSGSALDVAKSIARNQVSDFLSNLSLPRQTLDHPVFLELELIGNDVCSPHHGFDSFTTVAKFEKNIVEILEYLDTILPAGSHVLTMGLAQGSVLWDYMHARTHPIGLYPVYFSN